MQIAYLDCFSGTSGDMLLGALVDAGLPESWLREVLSHLPLPADSFVIEQEVVQGFAVTRVKVRGEEQHSAEHDQHGHEHDHGHHHHEHEHDHHHGHDHHHHHHHDDHAHGHHHEGHEHHGDGQEGHPHRNLADIAHILNKAQLPPIVHQRALAVFTRLAEAEAAAHGSTRDEIHFHEVGAIDALVDIVGVVAGLHYLGIEKLFCSALPMPSGWVHCAHGEIPLPAPAVCRLLEGVPVYGVQLAQELVTPTGAALICELAESFGPIPAMLMGRTGYGAGSRQRADGRPNLLRLILGESLELAEAQEVEVIETHLDDWNPEFWPLCSQRLMAAGALDVCLIPIQMKKGRPGFLLRVLTEPSRRQDVIALVFTETGTAGLRIRRESRITLPRKTIRINTPWGEVAAKQISSPDGARIVPEYEACRALAEQHGISLNRIYAEIRNNFYHS